jgi:hypothetical protein
MERHAAMATLARRLTPAKEEPALEVSFLNATMEAFAMERRHAIP